MSWTGEAEWLWAGSREQLPPNWFLTNLFWEILWDKSHHLLGVTVLNTILFKR